MHVTIYINKCEILFIKAASIDGGSIKLCAYKLLELKYVQCMSHLNLEAIAII